GISAKQLEREIGVSYPTALRMFRQIRSLLAQDTDLFSGTVEVDETYVGGIAKWRNQGRPVGPQGASKKSMVVGMAQRREGTTARLAVSVADPKVDGRSLLSRVTEKV